MAGTTAFELTTGYNAISAEPNFSGRYDGASCPVFNVTYNVSGANTDDVVSKLERVTGDLKDFVLDVMENERTDSARRAYR